MHGRLLMGTAVQVNYDFHHFVTPEKLDALLDELAKKK